MYIRDWDRLFEVLAIPEHVRWRYKNAEYMYPDHIASGMSLWFLTKFGRDFLWYLKYSWHNKLRDQLINGKVWNDLLYILNVTMQSQMFSVLNVNFGRELLPQGVTIPYTGKQRLWGLWLNIYLGADRRHFRTAGEAIRAGSERR